MYIHEYTNRIVGRTDLSICTISPLQKLISQIIQRHRHKITTSQGSSVPALRTKYQRENAAPSRCLGFTSSRARSQREESNKCNLYRSWELKLITREQRVDGIALVVEESIGYHRRATIDAIEPSRWRRNTNPRINSTKNRRTFFEYVYLFLNSLTRLLLLNAFLRFFCVWFAFVAGQIRATFNDVNVERVDVQRKPVDSFWHEIRVTLRVLCYLCFYSISAGIANL